MSKSTNRLSRLIGDVSSEIKQIRLQIADLKQQRDDILTHRVPKPEALARLLEFVDSEAESFDAWYRFGNAVATPDARQHDINGFEIMRGDSGPLLCWLLGDTIKQRLSRLIEQSDYIEGLPAAERESAVSRIEYQIIDLERSEEAIIAEAEEAGFGIQRRPDFDPAVVLEAHE